MSYSKVFPVLAGAAGGVFLVAAVLACGIWFDNQELKRRCDALQSQHQAVLSKLDLAQRAEQTAQSALAAQTAAIKTLETEMAALRSQVDQSASASIPERRAVRAQVYAGRQVLGEGWVLVGGVGTNGAPSGAVVSLDERLLKTLVEAAAKEIVAADRPREITVNHNYAENSPYWQTYWPVAWTGSPSRPPSTNRPPSGGITPPPTTLPPPNGNSGSIGIWRPKQTPFLPNPSPWPGVTPARSSPAMSPRVNPALPATQPVLLP